MDGFPWSYVNLHILPISNGMHWYSLTCHNFVWVKSCNIQIFFQNIHLIDHLLNGSLIKSMQVKSSSGVVEFYNVTSISSKPPRLFYQRYYITDTGNLIIQIRQSWDHLISIMEFPSMVRWHVSFGSDLGIFQFKGAMLSVKGFLSLR